jgi:hypothetical protein
MVIKLNAEFTRKTEKQNRSFIEMQTKRNKNWQYLEMQWKWKAWLHIPQATVHSSDVAEA